jgi:hypothetical protein
MYVGKPPGHRWLFILSGAGFQEQANLIRAMVVNP